MAGPPDAETLQCPMCGAPAATSADHCDHCGARLATVACPACFGLIFAGAKFCSHCGARVERTEVASAGDTEVCPRCRHPLEAVKVGTMNLRECPRCEGLWVDKASLEDICADRDRQSAVLGMSFPPNGAEPVQLEEKVSYVPCPVCHKLMNRVNFAHCSGIIVDICAQHGTWFDRDELRRIIEFIRAGGLETARARELAALEEQRRELKTARVANAWDSEKVGNSHTETIDLGLNALDTLLDLFRHRA